MRIEDHPILGKTERRKRITLKVDGEAVSAFEGESYCCCAHCFGSTRFSLHRKTWGASWGYFALWAVVLIA